MVAFSLYRGKLHSVPDVPRRWPTPTPKISVKTFKILIHRRNRALARLLSPPDTAATSSSNPNSDTGGQVEDQEEINGPPDSNDPPPPPSPLDALQDTNSEAEKVNDEEEEGDSEEGGADCGKKANNGEGLEGGDDLGKRVDGNGYGAAEVMVAEGPESAGAGDAIDLAGGSLEEKTLENPNEEATERVNISIEKEKRKKEVEEKLHILTERRHGLVKVLKQILNAEEKLNKRNKAQGAGTRPSVSLQVDVSNDSGSVTRNNTPRLGSNGNLDTEAGESDNASNQNAQSRHLPRMSSISPCSDTLHRKPFFSAAPHSSRSSFPLGSSSPSSFAKVPPPPPANPATVSGASYIASSPSPAGSGGTSAFRDISSTLPSPGS